MTWPSWLTAPSAWIARATAWAQGPRQIEDVKPGADYAADLRISQDYDPHDALSAMAAFGWVRACLDVIGADLAGLPLVVYRGRGSDAVRVDGHPALDLLDQPTTDLSREVWERQLLVYLLLTGNAYALLIGTGEPVSLPLVHPERCKPSPTAWGGIAGYTVGLEQTQHYEPSAVLHWRLTSWESAPVSLLGEGLARALHNDLTADLNAAKLSAAQAQRGRPSAILSPSEAGDMWSAETRKEIVDAYSKQTATGGPIAIGKGVKIETPAFTARDMEFAEQRAFTRQEILAAFGVPPVRVGLETANYATAQQQSRIYWEGLRGLSRLIDSQLSRVAQGWDRSLRIAHDFSGVEALQESRTARLDRVAAWVTLGATPAAAAAYEGFDDAPVGEVAEPAPVTNPAADPARSVARAAPPTSAEARADLWRRKMERVHTPAEARLARALGAALRAQRARVVARLDVVASRSVTRDLIADVMAWIWPPEERAVLGDAADSLLRRTLEEAFAAAAKEVGTTLAYDPSALSASLSVGVDRLTGPVADTTRAAVQEVIETELARGGTIADMQARLQALPAFGPSRALMVARTETTRAVGAGTDDAHTAAVVAGVALRKQWLSARDSEVRDAHVLLDGQTVPAGGMFVVPAASPVGAGQRARFPGDFDSAALVVNCRCVTIPVLDEEAA